MLTVNIESLLEQLKGEATRRRWSDDSDFYPDYYSGGNVDNAYSGGLADGQTLYARSLLKAFFPEESYVIDPPESEDPE